MSLLPTSGSKRRNRSPGNATPMQKLPIAKPEKAETAPRKRFCGVKGRSGAPKGNTNAIRHGLKGGKLPADCQYIENRCNALRRQVEAALIAVKGAIGIVDAAAVNSVLKWERHGLLAAHWLRKEAAKLNPSERLKFSEAIAKASDARDKALRSLSLDVKPEPIDLKTYLIEGNGK